MADANQIIRQRQLDVRCEMDARGIHLKAVASKSGIPYPTIISYFPGEKDRQPATIPGSAIFAILDAEALPLDIVSMLLPGGMLIVRAPEEVNHDEVEAACRDYLAVKGSAHRQDSPKGPALAECETEALNEKVVHLRAATA